MRYFDKAIVPRDGERVLYRARLHWTIFVSPSSLLTLFVLPLVRWWTSEAVVTTRRIVMSTGWLRRYTFEMPVTRVESIRVEEALLARLLGFGSVLVIGVGGGRQLFTRMARPLAFRRAAEQAVYGA